MNAAGTVTVLIEMDLQTRQIRLQAPDDSILVWGLLEAAKGIVHAGQRAAAGNVHASGLAVVQGPAAQAIARDARLVRP